MFDMGWPQEIHETKRWWWFPGKAKKKKPQDRRTCRGGREKRKNKEILR